MNDDSLIAKAAEVMSGHTSLGHTVRWDNKEYDWIGWWRCSCGHEVRDGDPLWFENHVSPSIVEAVRDQIVEGLVEAMHITADELDRWDGDASSGLGGCSPGGVVRHDIHTAAEMSIDDCPSCQQRSDANFQDVDSVAMQIDPNPSCVEFRKFSEDEVAALDGLPIVCIAHGAFIPCRKDGEHRYSSNPYWVKSVRDYQGSSIVGLTWEPAWE